jgi:NCAIR mutase (PurE)-related protein
MNEERVRALLEEVQTGTVSIEAATDQLRRLPFEELGFATLDHHRALRQGFPEVIYCAGKTPEQTAAIAERLAVQSDTVLGTRATRAHYEAAQARVPDLQWHEEAKAIYIERNPRPKKKGIVVVSAGTSDLPVAAEAALTASLMGNDVLQFHDIGVAGLHRLLHRLPALQEASAIVAVAGMEGALPSVLAGLVAAPVIAVPTSVGYGASFGGIAALLAMLNSCASGIAVVNIDNGFGAGYMAGLINRQVK